MAVNPPEVYAWDDAGNNRWLISGKGSGIMNPPSAWAVAKRDNPKVAENCWTHPMPTRPEGPLRRPAPAILRLVELLEEQAGGQGAAALSSRRSRRSQSWSRRRSATTCRPSRACTTSTPGRPSGRRVGTVYGYPPRGDEQTSIAGAPARSEVGAQIYNQAINTVMVAKFTQGGEKLDDVIKWAENELEGTLRA